MGSSLVSVLTTVFLFVPLWIASQYFSITREMTDKISSATACLRYVGIMLFIEILITQIASTEVPETPVKPTTSKAATTSTSTKVTTKKAHTHLKKQIPEELEESSAGIWLFFRAVSKGLASTSFIMTAFYVIGSERLINADIHDPHQLAQLLIVLGLILGWIGDMFLLIRSTFLLGLVAFLFGHVAYVGAFFVTGLDIGFTQVGAVLVVLQGLPIAMWLLPKVSSSMKVPVAAYVVVITVMVVAAIGAYGYAFFAELPPHVDNVIEYIQADYWRLVSATGSIPASAVSSATTSTLLPTAFRRLLAAEMFYLSDICVARNKFVQRSCWNSAVGLPLYYIAQLLFAASL
jgi:uncharacterized membrane protein YhhN